MKRLLYLALLSLPVACAPAPTNVVNVVNTTERAYDPSLGGKQFTMSVDGQEIRSNGGGVFNYTDDAVEYQVELGQKSFVINVVNSSKSTVKIIWDESAIVLSDGEATRIVTTKKNWSNRNDPTSPSIIPSGAKLTEELMPLKLLSMSNGKYYYDNMFKYPIKSKTSFRFVLTVQYGENKKEKQFIFTGSPE